MLPTGAQTALIRFILVHGIYFYVTAAYVHNGAQLHDRHALLYVLLSQHHKDKDDEYEKETEVYEVRAATGFQGQHDALTGCSWFSAMVVARRLLIK
jgi:hypothetical protein